MTSAHGPAGTAGAGAGPELRVLGPFSLVVDGVPLELGGRKARALVAVLALEGPRPRAELAELLWGDLGEPRARSNLRKTLHTLRETRLGAYLDAGGETVACRGARVDALEFGRLVVGGEPEQALLLGEGTLLDGLDLESEAWTEWLDGHRTRHTALRRQVQLDVATGREARGDVRGALALVSRVLDLDAFDERALGEAMRLHLTLGDRGQARALYERFRALTASLGLVPDGATRALAERARRDSPGHSPPAGNNPARTEGLRAPLVGREASWLQLHQSGSPLTVLVGEPGVGKTRLATQFAGAHGAGLTLRGREETRHTPFSPVAHLIREALETRRWSPDGLGDVWRLEVARLVPECAPGTVPPPAVGDGRARFLEGLSRAVTHLLGGQMLVLDDLHWFDEGTLELVSHLVRRGDTRCVATARGLELETSGVARHMLGALRRDGLSETLPLGPLGEPDVLALVQGLSGAGGGVLFARRLHAASRGNPLYILELLRGLLETGLLTSAPEGGWATPFDESTRDYAELPIPPSLRETVLERVARLGPLSRRLLGGAALAGEPFESAWLAGIEADGFARLDALEEACRADLLEPVPGGFHFRHELLRRALDESLGPERRRLTHLTLAHQLQAAQAPPERVASHFERAGRGEEALPHLGRAAEAAARVYAHREALAYIDRAIGHAGDGPPRWPLEVRRVRLLRQLTDLEAYGDGLDRLERLAEAGGGSDERAQAYLQRGMYHLWRGQSAEALRQARRALGLPGLSRPLEVEALYLSGHAQVRLGQVGLGHGCLTRALERARTGGEGVPDELIGSIENGLTGVALYLGEYGRALGHNARAGAAWAGSSEALALFTPSSRGTLQIHLGQFGAARHTLGEAVTVALEHDHPSALSFAYRARALLELNEGHASAAAHDIARGLRLCRGKNLRLEAQLGGLHARRCWADGQLGEAVDSARTALDGALTLNVAPLIAELRLLRAALHAELGDAATAWAELGRVVDLGADLGDEGVLRPYRATLDTVAARLEYRAGLTESALERLRGTSCLENATFLDHWDHRLELARVLALTGDAPAALARLGEPGCPSPLEARALGARLEAHLTLGEVPEDVLGRAISDLDLDHAAPTDRLDLMITVLRALGRAGRDPSAVRAHARATLTALADGLDGHPELRAGLLRRFEAVLGD
ncbi:AAA family ATPase [Deinococcus sp. YIM 134068]|uniref:ATP-binding protein n=1 Tax=Deinococcus lichenicola TaxID=3118910 RepID=UPI002F9380EF